jgi:5-formyltetrahydrofolate cyclo-ligase
MSFHKPGAIFGATSIAPAITCHALVITVKASKHPSAWQVANPESIPTNKATLRTRMRQLLREHTHDSATVREAVSRWLIAHPEVHTLSAFAALPGEPDLLPLLAEFPDRQWIFPRVENTLLMLHPVADPSTDLLPGAFGIREPSPALPVVDVTEIDAFLCPGLALDLKGGRLGRGRGFYDRLLAKARPNARKLGIAFPFQLVADTFPEPHDIRMDKILIGEP